MPHSVTITAIIPVHNGERFLAEVRRREVLERRAGERDCQRRHTTLAAGRFT